MWSRSILHHFLLSQELFTKIDLEDDGVVYLKEIVLYLRAMNEDIVSLKVDDFFLSED